MTRHAGARAAVAVLAVLAAVGAAGCSSPERIASADTFRNARRIETDLVRGASTGDDVRRVLGAPTGRGGAFLPSSDPAPRDVLFYDDIEVTDFTVRQGEVRMDVRQQILLVFLRDDRFDGFLWFSNAADATAWVPGTHRLGTR